MVWAPDYVTTEDLKDYLRIPADDTADDVFIALWITAASRNVDDFCGRQFGQVDAPEAREYLAAYDRHAGGWFADIDDVMDVDALTVADSSAAPVSDYTLLPANATLRRRPYERIRVPGPGPYTVAAPWGWDQAADGPKVAKLGLLLQGARLAARRDSPFGIAGSPAEGSEIQLLARLDPDFKTTLKPFVRKWWAA